MTAPYWVIREGKAHDQGRYWNGFNSLGLLQVWDEQVFAWRIRDEIRARYELTFFRYPARLVRVTRKPKPAAELTQENAERVYANGHTAGRFQALDEAERICRERAQYDVTASCSTCVAVMTACANAIAALKVRP